MILSDCISIYSGLMTLYKKELPILASYKISSAINKLEPIVSDFQKNRDEIISKLKSKSDSNGDVDDDSAKEFKEAMSFILEEEVDVVIDTIDLSSVENLSVSPEVVRLCGDSVIFIKDA